MSFSDIHPGDPINAINVQQVIDALKGTAGKGVPLTVSAVNDSARYALTLENTEATNSRALNVLKNDGSVLIRADATGVTLGQPLNLPTGSITSGAIADGTIATADLANGAVTNVKLGTDTARLNLLTNGGFEIWQRGTGPFTATGAYAADRWSVVPSGTDTLSVSRDTTNVNNSVAAAACTFTLGTGAGNTIFQQATGRAGDGLEQLRNKTVSFAIDVRCATANAVRAWVTPDGAVTKTFSAYHTGDGTWQRLTVTLALGAATDVRVGVAFAASCTAYVDNAMLVVGSVAADYAPLHPADDLARCLRYYERIDDDGAGNLSVSGIASAAGQFANLSAFFKAGKPINPTITQAGTWTTTNAGALSWQGGGTKILRLFCSSSAAGFFSVADTGAGANIVVEANP